ncbi:hypothetical protein DL239_16895 [Sedimentitalea sp. CY04]|uniref:PH domain-containing protein n=1 Tax=Parasedimentitalea denitrificans TaxID=2211118 RepID=A0ABX0WAF8_9RHOB|nr:hypothetical protein [Sedimentitalea sp. CY04]NIZ62651.1 hypothetical protein [Sedimentitalea sp. CY04]
MTTFIPDRTAYIRSHAWMAALAMAAGMVILWAMGNPHVWTGAIGGLAAIVLRGWYLMSEDLAVVWTLSDTHLTGPAERNVPLSQIERVRTMGSYVQVVTKSGDKHLIKYLVDPAAAMMAIQRAKA